MAVTSYETQLKDATWIDVNPRYGQDNLPDRLPDGLAIVKASLYNLLNCAPGERSRTFQPTYGSLWRQFIHEPICDMTAMKMETFMVKAIEHWEPRIQLDTSGTRILPDNNLPGYQVRLAFYLPNIPGLQSLQFNVLL